MKKILSLILISFILIGCSTNKENTTTKENTATSETPTTTTINVYTRDSSSGTREAFEKGIDLDELSINSIEVSSNGDMVTKIKNDPNSIGYASLSTDFKALNVKPVSLNNIEASIATVLDNSYLLQRPFSFVTRAKGDFDSEEKEQLVSAFIEFITNSKEGRQIVESSGGVVDVEGGIAWEELKSKYPIVEKDNSSLTLSTSGSTSVEKTLQAALEAFTTMAGNFNFTMNQTGSSDGYKRVLGEEKDGVNASDIGFASRNFKDKEVVSEGMVSGEYCRDAVVVIVNIENKLENISKEDLASVYKGNIKVFEDINK